MPAADRADGTDRRPAGGTARAGLVLLLVLALLSPLAAAGTETREVGGVRITLDSPWPPGVLTGWMPVTVSMTNLNAEQVEVRSTTRQASTGDSQASSRLRLDPGQQRRVSWLVPVLRNHDTDIDLDVRVFGSGDWARMTISDEPGTPKLANAFTLIALAPGEAEPLNGLPGEPTLVRHDALPADWRAYSSLARLVLSTADGLPEAPVRDALLTWVAAGGVLQVSGPIERLELPLDPRFETPRDRLDSDSDLISQHRHGFGWIQHTRSPRPDLTPHWKQDRFTQPTSRPRPGVLAHPLGSLSHLSGVEAVPRRLLAVVLVVFFLLMGPVQFHLLKRRGAAPVKLLLTTPALGLAFGSLVLATALFHQGFNVRQLVTSVSWLDQERHHVACLAQRSVYSGSIFDSSLRYDAGTASAGLVTGMISRLSFQVDLDRGVLSGSYLPVRTPSWELQARSATARQRLAVEWDGDQLFVVNGLGTTLLDLALHDEQDQAWRLAGPLPAGERVALERSEPLTLRLAASTNWGGRDRLELLPTAPTESPQLWPSLARELPGVGTRSVPGPRTYVALLADSPFLDDGGVVRDTELGQHLLYGDLGPVP